MSGMLVLKLSSGCIIAEITLGVKAMAEEGEVVCKMGPFREWKDCQRQDGDKEGKEHTATDLIKVRPYRGSSLAQY